MPGSKVTSFPTQTTLDDADYMPTVDVSDHAQAATGTDKKNTLAILKAFIDAAGIAASAVSTHNADTTGVHGIADTADLGHLSTGIDITTVLANLGISNFHVVSFEVTSPTGAALTTGDGKKYWRVPSTLDGYNLVAVAMHVVTASTSGIPTFQIANVTTGFDMLTTKLTVDATEVDSLTAATPAVIDTAHDDVHTGNLLRFDCDVAGTGTKGVLIELQIQKP
jgi:hypothetical protein